jgi:hypothetical protein
MRPLPQDVQDLLGGYDAALPPADRLRILRQVTAEARLRLARLVSSSAAKVHAPKDRSRGAA